MVRGGGRYLNCVEMARSRRQDPALCSTKTRGAGHVSEQQFSVSVSESISVLVLKIRISMSSISGGEISVLMEDRDPQRCGQQQKSAGPLLASGPPGARACRKLRTSSTRFASPLAPNDALAPLRFAHWTLLHDGLISLNQCTQFSRRGSRKIHDGLAKFPVDTMVQQP